MQGRHHLAKMLETTSVADFLTQYWEKNLLHCVGRRGRFVPLLSWRRLETILREQRLAYPRLRLFRSGALVDRARYSTQDGRLQPDDLYRELSSGATLVLDCVDEAHRPLRNFAVNCEKFFGCPVNINAYAAWKTQHGFDIHFDTQDNFILQIYGRKRWRIWEPTREYPLPSDTAEPPKTSPIWEGPLSDGSLLYIPRGWWHEASPLGEPSLHLTVSIKPPTGVDFIQSLVFQLRSSIVARRNLPTLGDAEARQQVVDLLRSELAALCVPARLNLYLSKVRAVRLRRVGCLPRPE